MIGGNQPREGGYLILSDKEKSNLLEQYPDAVSYIKRLVGTREMLNDLIRWCIWIEENQVDSALKIPELARRVELVKQKRSRGNTLEKNFAHMPYRFVQINKANERQIIIPNVSTDRREYLPIDFVDAEIIVTNLAMMILDGDIFTFGIVASKLHGVWVRTVAGRLGDAIRYTVGLCYNTFPVPQLSEVQKEKIREKAFDILDERELHPEKTLAELYDPDKMPKNLRQAHQELDLAVEQCYRPQPFSSDEERLEYLFKLYEEMIAAEKKKGVR